MYTVLKKYVVFMFRMHPTVFHLSPQSISSTLIKTGDTIDIEASNIYRYEFGAELRHKIKIALKKGTRENSLFSEITILTFRNHSSSKTLTTLGHLRE
jgi:hypothetical protein